MSKCKHHYMLNASNEGTCKYCGKVRQFLSWPEAMKLVHSKSPVIPKTAKYENLFTK